MKTKQITDQMLTDKGICSTSALQVMLSDGRITMEEFQEVWRLPSNQREEYIKKKMR